MNWNQRQDSRPQQNWTNQQQQSGGYGRQGSQPQSSNYQQSSYGQGQSAQSYNQPYVPTVQTQQTGSYGYNDNQNQGQYYPSTQTSSQPQAQSSYYSQQARGPTQSAQPVQQRYNPTTSSQYMPSSGVSSQQQQYNPSSGPSQQYNPRTSQQSTTQGLGQYSGVTSSGAQSTQQSAPNLNNLSQILSSLTNLSGLVGSNQQSMPSAQPSNVMSGGLNLGSSNTAGINSLLRGVQQQQQPQQQVQLPGNLSQLLQNTGSQTNVTPQQQNQALQLLTAQLLQQQQQQQQQNAGYKMNESTYKPATQSHMSMPSRPIGAPVTSQSRFNDRGFSSGPPQRNPTPIVRGRSSAPAPRSDFGGRGGHRGSGGRDFDRDRTDRDRNDRGHDDRKRFDRDPRDRDRNDRDRPVRSDRDRNDRDRPYRRSKSPEHKRDKSPPPKPREKTPPKTVEPAKDTHAEAPKKELSEKDKEREREKRKYECKVSAHEINAFERDYASTRRRYENLYITPDFAKSVSAWLHSVPLEDPLPLDHHVPFTCDNEFREITDPVNNEAPALQVDHTRWFAKVVLLTGYSADDYDEIMDSDKQKDLTQKIKFIVQRQDRSQLMLLGGEWEPTVDGDGDPAQDATLIPAAIRHVREQLQLDLSPCTRWYRFLEIHYHRVVPNTVPAMVARDITVIYVPSVWDLIPSMDDFMDTWEQREYTKLKRQKDKEERARLEREKIERERLEKQEKERAEKEKQEKERIEKEKQEAAASESAAQDQPINLNQSSDQPAEPSTESAAPEATTTTASAEQPAQTVAETKHESEPTSKSESEIVVDKSKAPKDVTLYLNTKREKFLNRKTAQLSLDGLLDYDYEGDRWEPTFEVSLFAENFHEMLQRDFGHIVLQAIMSARPEKQAQDKKRRREDTSEEERAAKKPKTEETKPAEGAQTEQTAKPEMTSQAEPQSEVPPQEPTAVAVEPKSEDAKTEEAERKINYSLKFAFEFFDRNRTGYLKSEDVETMFHALGFHASKNQMHAVLNHQLDTKHRLVYKNLLFAEENDAPEPADQNTDHAPEQEQMDLNA